MIPFLFFALVGSQMLAPSPINFTKERVVVEGEAYIVRCSNNRISIEKEPHWMDKVMRSHLMRHIANTYRKPPKDPNENTLDPVGCMGCFGAVIFLIAFWSVVGFLIWRLFS